MIDKTAMRGLLKNIERAAEEILRQDSAFFQVLKALKWEIDSDSRVQSAVRGLQAAGQRVFSSFVPHIKVKIRTEEGIFELPKSLEMSNIPVPEPLATLTQELKNAATAVILTSRHCRELERIVNEAVAASDNFEKLASHIEGSGHEVLISLDLSAYAHFQKSSGPLRLPPASSEESARLELSANDLGFLKALGIGVHEDLRH